MRVRSSSWSAIVPAAALDPNSERPKRAPSSSAQLTRRTVAAGSPSSAIRRSTSTPAITLSAPSSQPPFGTESMCPPMSSAFSPAPSSVNHWLPASSTRSSAPVSRTLAASHSRACTHVSVHATRCAPSSLPVSSRSSRSSSTVRLVCSATARQLNAPMQVEFRPHGTRVAGDEAVGKRPPAQEKGAGAQARGRRQGLRTAETGAEVVSHVAAVHLYVTDLDRSVDFYSRLRGHGPQAASDEGEHAHSAIFVLAEG